MPESNARNNPSPTPRRLVRCEQCGRSRAYSASDLLRFTRQGWPKCCGQVMALVTETEKPDDGTPSPPPLPS